MEVSICLPEIAGEVSEVVFVEWLIELGAQIHAGQPIAVVEADKAQIEVASPATGRLSRISAAPDDPITAGQVLGSLEVP